MFREIGRSIALQFTALVWLLLLTVGAVFFAVSYLSQRRLSDDRLQVDAQRIVADGGIATNDPQIGFREAAEVRSFNASGQSVYVGEFFLENTVPLPGPPGSIISVEGQDNLDYRVINDKLGSETFQLAEPVLVGEAEYVREAGIFLVISTVLSVMIYALGLRFAQGSLTPAQEMVTRLQQFTQDASHELRTPLAVLGSTLDLALETGEYKDGIISAQDDLREANNLVERLLELARLDRYGTKLEPVDLGVILAEVAEKTAPLAEAAGLTLTREIVPGVQLPADAALVRQLVTNLVSNAIKFNQPGGTIAICLDRHRIEIVDTGVGIAEQALSQVFERFYQADASRSQSGLGLGLAIVKRIVELHGWQIGVTSKIDEGSRFVISFPRPRRA
jgi:signal transduction histidine kinase